MHTQKSKKALNQARNAFDEAVSGLSPGEYKSVIDDMAAHIESCEDCLREENPDMFED